LEQHGAHDGEDGGVAADAERQREDGARTEGRRRRITRIASRRSLHITTLLVFFRPV
jgi:hypothetical protein